MMTDTPTCTASTCRPTERAMADIRQMDAIMYRRDAVVARPAKVEIVIRPGQRLVYLHRPERYEYTLRSGIPDFAAPDCVTTDFMDKAMEAYSRREAWSFDMNA